MGTCLNTWNEHAWHWVTLVSMLIFVHFLSVWERAAHHFCTCTHFLSRHKHETNACTHIHSLTCAHTCMCICSHCDTLFLSLSPSLTHNPQFTSIVRSNGNVSIGALVALLIVSTFDANIKEMTSLILLSPVFWWSFAPYAAQHGCSKQMFQLVFAQSQNKVEENFIVLSKIQLLKICHWFPSDNMCQWVTICAVNVDIYCWSWQYIPGDKMCCNTTYSFFF